MKSGSPYTQYPTRPRFLKDIGEGGDDVVEFLDDNTLILRPSKEHGLPFEEIRIPQDEVGDRVRDLVSHVFRGWMDDLISGTELMEKFLRESQEESSIQWVYYPRKRKLAKFMSPFWYRVALVIRNERLLRDPEMSMGWEEVLDILSKTVVSVAGCSVGSNVAAAIAGDLRPLHMKLADYKDFHVSNANRVPVLSFEDFGQNKAEVIAEHIHGIDPFMDISVYSEGINIGNIVDFVAGNEGIGEPPSSVIIEETDDVYMKILIREEARRRKIPVIMVTDLGSIFQIDVRRFDVAGDLPIAACTSSDDELYEKRDIFETNKTRDNFLSFAFALIGNNYRSSEELRRFVDSEEPPLFGGLPQLGSTAMAAAGFASETTARLVLGHEIPERVTVDKKITKNKTKEEIIKVEGEWL